MTTLATFALAFTVLFVIGAAGVLAAWAAVRWLLRNSEKDNPRL